MPTSFQKTKRGRDSSLSSFLIDKTPFCRATSVIQANGDHHHFFCSDTDPILSHWFILSTKPCSGCLVVAVQYNFFKLFSNAKQISRLRRIRRSYINCPVIAPTNHCQKCTALLLGVCISKRPCYFFCSSLLSLYYYSPMHLRNLFLLSTPVARILLTPRSISDRKE